MEGANLWCSCNTFGARVSHEHTQIQKTHHSPDLGEATTFPLIILFVISHKGYIQMSFCLRTPKLGVSKLPRLGLLTFWKAIISCANLWLRWELKQNYSPHHNLSNDMWHPTYMHVFQGDSRLLVVGSQIANLTPNISFSHNLYLKYSNGSCELIVDI
jgi:hypothetical protein